jgi:hypothetical protein
MATVSTAVTTGSRKYRNAWATILSGSEFSATAAQLIKASAASSAHFITQVYWIASTSGTIQLAYDSAASAMTNTVFGPAPAIAGVPVNFVPEQPISIPRGSAVVAAAPTAAVHFMYVAGFTSS